MGKLPDGTHGSEPEDSPNSVNSGEDNDAGTGATTKATDETSPDDTTAEEGSATAPETEVPAGREELRRQQRLVAVGIGLLAGVALAASAVQQFPDRPLVFPVVSGVLGAGIVFWLASKGLAPVDGDTETRDRSDDRETESVGAGDDTA